MTSAPTKSPTLLDVLPPEKHEKYELLRGPGEPILPEPGARRFSACYMREAMRLDPTFDGVRAEDQSDWQQYDVCDQQGWLFWVGGGR